MIAGEAVKMRVDEALAGEERIVQTAGEAYLGYGHAGFIRVHKPAPSIYVEWPEAVVKIEPKWDVEAMRGRLHALRGELLTYADEAEVDVMWIE